MASTDMVTVRVAVMMCWFGADFLLLLESSAEVKVCRGLQWNGYIKDTVTVRVAVMMCWFAWLTTMPDVF
jgi:hypothetical protein